MSNNIVNVPLRVIARDLDAPVSAAVLCVSAFVLTLAVAMPLAGWLGDRIGQKQTLLMALGLMLVAQVGAALSIDLRMLIALRAVQGLACSAIPPMVMGLLAGFSPTSARAPWAPGQPRTASGRPWAHRSAASSVTGPAGG